MTTAVSPSPGSPAESRGRRWRRHLVTALLYTAIAPAVLASALGFFGKSQWIFDLLSHFRFQYTLWLALWAVLAVVLRRRNPAVLAVVFTLLNGAPLLHYLPARPSAPGSSPDLRVVAFNILEDNLERREVLAWLQAQEADVLILPEFSSRWLYDFKPLEEHFPHTFKNPGFNNFGMAIYSRFPLEERKREHFCAARVPCLTAKILVNGRPLRLAAVHPVSPLSQEEFATRNEHLRNLATRLQKDPVPTLVAGDFNTTAFSSHFSAFRKSTGLHDAARRRGYHPTYERYHSFFALPIDHILHPPQWTCTRFQVGPPLGSDHRPLVADFTFGTAER